jgi:hypothetical protein
MRAVIKQLIAKAAKNYNISETEAAYFVFTDTIFNNAYNKDDTVTSIL